MDEKKVIERVGVGPGVEEPSQLAVARALWAKDPDVHIDLHALGSSLMERAASGKFHHQEFERAVHASWAEIFKVLSRMDEKKLASGQAWPWPTGHLSAQRLRLAVSSSAAGSGSGAPLRMARRRWAQAMSLSGALGCQNDIVEQFGEAAKMCFEWQAKASPDMGSPVDVGRPLAQGIEHAQREVCAKALESLLVFGEQAGHPDPAGAAIAAMSLIHRIYSKYSFGRDKAGGPGLSEERWRSQIEAAWLGLAAPAPKSGKPGGVRI